MHGMVGWDFFGVISTFFLSELTDDVYSIKLGNIKLARGPKMRDIVNVWRCSHDGIYKLDQLRPI